VREDKHLYNQVKCNKKTKKTRQVQYKQDNEDKRET
jgi:hypothetical protein